LAISAVLFHAIEAAIWAVMYIRLNVLSDFSQAYLHSLGAFSTYGNSGYDLNTKWRLLSQIEAMNGIVAFGLTTAFLYSAAHLIHQNSEETEVDFLKTGK
jgi:ABC-type transport system involved in multi-copper enzyme maturation permease subunit